MANKLSEDEKDQLVFDEISNCGEAGAGVAFLVNAGIRPGTVRSSLKRLLTEGSVTRQWDGNGRFGRYLYRAAR